MGAQTSRPKRVTRSVSFNGSQRDTYREFDMELFKIDCEIRFSRQLQCEQISEIKQRLYCLRQHFDASRMKEKYELDFKCKYRRVIDNLEDRIQQKSKRTSRKKYLAPLPPEPEPIRNVHSDIEELGGIVANFRGRRDGDKYNKLHRRILSMLFKLTTLQVGGDVEKYAMMKELLEILKQLEDQALENDEMAVNCD